MAKNLNCSLLHFLVESWNRICYEYTEAVREGVRVILRALPEGCTRDAFTAYALSPYRNSTKRMWRWPNVFSFTAKDGMWIGRILPEVEEQLETTRIAGSTHLRTTPSLGDILGQQDPLKKKSKKERERENEKHKKPGLIPVASTLGPLRQLLVKRGGIPPATLWVKDYAQPSTKLLNSTLLEIQLLANLYVGTLIQTPGVPSTVENALLDYTER